MHGGSTTLYTAEVLVFCCYFYILPPQSMPKPLPAINVTFSGTNIVYQSVMDNLLNLCAVDILFIIIIIVIIIKHLCCETK